MMIDGCQFVQCIAQKHLYCAMFSGALYLITSYLHHIGHFYFELGRDGKELLRECE